MVYTWFQNNYKIWGFFYKESWILITTRTQPGPHQGPKHLMAYIHKLFALDPFLESPTSSKD